MILNGEYIRRRRRDLRLSQRFLAKQLAVTSRVIAALEEGTNHATLPIGFVCDLADQLGVDVRDLSLKEPPPPADGFEELAAQIGAFLFQTGTLVGTGALAEAFDVTLDEIDDALRLLEAGVETVGLSLQRTVSGDVALHPKTPLDTEAQRRLVRQHHARRGLSLTEARVLYRLLDGPVDEGKLSNPESVALNRLRHAGIATEDGQATLLPDARLSMLVGECAGVAKS